MSLFRRKKKEESKPAVDENNYWVKNFSSLPVDDMLNNRDESFLKGIFKNDSNIHRRTFALAILWNIIDKDHDEFSSYAAELCVDCGMDFEEFKPILHDYADLMLAAKTLDIWK